MYTCISYVNTHTHTHTHAHAHAHAHAHTHTHTHVHRTNIVNDATARCPIATPGQVRPR